jgi:hypothetical protein
MEKNTQEGSLVDRNATEISRMSERLEKVRQVMEDDRTLDAKDMGFLKKEEDDLIRSIERLKTQAKTEINSPVTPENTPLIEG